jgi:hypothetical protein
MPAKETIKLYMVVALAFLALVVAYFQFFSKKEEPAPQVAAPKEQTQRQQKATATATAGGKSYKIRTLEKISEISTGKTREKWRPSLVNLTDIRDIFEPPPIPPEAIEAAVAVRRAQRVPKEPKPDEISLELKGTIIGGKKPMAIINEKFIRLGEKIDIFRVVRIEANRVVLKAGDHVRTLTVLKPDELLKQ